MKTRDASDRLLPPNRTACTRTSCVPGSLSPLSRRGGPVETKAPRSTTGGPDVSRRPKTASADRAFNAMNFVLYCLTAWRYERGRFLPTALNPIEPLTPLSHPSFLPSCSPSRASSERDRRLPRPPLPPSRESRCQVMIRDAFHQQGLFVGFGGRYSPGPATASPLLAMVRPLDDDLSPP